MPERTWFSMVIYADVLLFLNTVVTYFLLLSVCAVAHVHRRFWRLLLGSVAGGISAFAVLLPDLGLFAVPFKFAIAAVIVLITFSYHSAKRFFKLTALFFAVSFLYSFIAFWYTRSGIISQIILESLQLQLLLLHCGDRYNQNLDT